MITPKEYNKAVKERDNIWLKEKSQQSKLNIERNKTEDKYLKLERSIRHRKQKKLNELDDKLNKTKDKLKSEMIPHKEKIEEFKSILKFMEVSKKTGVDLNIEVYYYDYPKNKDGSNDYSKEKQKYFIEPIDILMDNELFQIGIYIFENKKPVNKYSLAVIGRSVINNSILNLEVPYLQGMNDNGTFKKMLRELPKREYLMKFFDKNKHKIFRKEIKEIDEIIKRYKNIISNTKTKVWEIAHLEDNKRYYEEEYSHGTGTKEYAKVINELINLVSGKKKDKYKEILRELIVNKLSC